MIEGSVEVGVETIIFGEQQVAWLDRSSEKGNSQIRFTAGKKGGRFIFYACEPQGGPIISHGPFIGDTKKDIARPYLEYRQGKMGHVHDLPEKQIVPYVAVFIISLYKLF